MMRFEEELRKANIRCADPKDRIVTATYTNAWDVALDWRPGINNDFMGLDMLLALSAPGSLGLYACAVRALCLELGIDFIVSIPKL